MRPFIRYATEFFIIIAGVIILFIPSGRNWCIVCGPVWTSVVGVIAVFLGVASFAVDRPTAAPKQPGAMNQ